MADRARHVYRVTSELRPDGDGSLIRVFTRAGRVALPGASADG